MHPRLKRIASAGAAIVVAAGTASALFSSPAFAAGTNAGPATIVVPNTTTPLNQGGSATAFSLALGTGASCTGDSPNANYRVQSYMVPVSRDPSTLTFNSAGPVTVAGQFSGPLFDTTGSPYVNKSTSAATPPSTAGPIIQPLPAFDFQVYSPGNIPAGVYNVGVACTLGPASSTQEDKFWNTVMTVTTDPADSPAQIHWAAGAVPSAPTLTAVTPGNASCAATYTSPAATPAATSWTVTATPSSGPALTGSGTASSGSVTGLTNGTSYQITVTQTNSTGTSTASNALSCTPAIPPHPAVGNLQATPATGSINLTWNAPSDAGTSPPTGYTVSWSPATAGSPMTVTTTSATATGLTAGTLYTFTVTATYAAPQVGTPAMVQATPLAAQVLVQNITVTRPTGALVFTQVCGTNAAFAANSTATLGFPNGVPAVAAAGPGTAPTVTGGGADPQFSQYPYPTAADGTPTPSYPTTCGINLGSAQFVTKGAGAGQFFATSGVINQVTVVDTRDTDIGWTANGTMGTFTNGANHFSGSQLGWAPVVTSTTPAFTDSDGNTYDQVANPGAVVAPNSPNASGLSSGRALGTAAGLTTVAPNSFTGGLGIAMFDARLELLIPVTAKSGTYTGTLTVSAV